MLIFVALYVCFILLCRNGLIFKVNRIKWRPKHLEFIFTTNLGENNFPLDAAVASMVVFVIVTRRAGGNAFGAS